jgi:transglutaminase-like putative cysteine protease
MASLGGKFNPKRLALPFLVVFFLLVGPTSGGDDPLQEILELTGLKQLPTQEDYPDHPAVVLYDGGEFSIEVEKGVRLDFNTELKKRHVLLVLNPLGKSYGNLKIYFGHNSKIIDFEGRVITPQGKIVKLDEKQLMEVTAFPEFFLYSDAKAKVAAFPEVLVGSIIDYRYTKRYKSPLAWDTWNFQGILPTVKSSYTLILPRRFFRPDQTGDSDWLKWRHKTYGIPEEPRRGSIPKVAPPGEERYLTYTWSADNLPGIRPEPFMPPLSQVRARVIFSDGVSGTWRDIGDRYYELIEKRLIPSASLRRKAWELTSDLGDELEKIRSIYYFVRDNIRYVAIHLGQGGYVPHYPREVFDNKYGDCKDVSALLVSMLKVIGIDAHPVLLSTKDYGSVDTTVCSLDPFNHMIVYIPREGGPVWLDATSKFTPFNSLPWQDRNLPALIIRGEGTSRFVTTPQSNKRENLSKRVLRFIVDPEGNLTGDGLLEYGGTRMEKVRSDFTYASREESQKAARRYLNQWCPGATLTDVRLENFDHPEGNVRIHLSFRVNGYADEVGPEMVFFANVLNRLESTAPFSEERREHSLFFYDPYTEIDTLTFLLPEGYQLESYPSAAALSCKCALYRSSCRIDGDTLRYHRFLEQEEAYLDPYYYREVKEFFERVSAADREMVLLKKM